MNYNDLLHTEINFWKEWLRTQGAIGGKAGEEEFRERVSPDTELNEDLVALLNISDLDTVSILDVGAGPLTLVGRRYKSKQLRLTATDFLADEYNKILTDLNIVPPVKTLQVSAMELDTMFKPESFDLIFTKNCVDHMESPLVAIDQMMRLLKNGGIIYMAHVEHEGKNQNYGGLHLWDFFIEDSVLYLKSANGSLYNISRIFEDANCDVVRLETRNNYVIAIFRKN